jgi:hypothetical protein
MKFDALNESCSTEGFDIRQHETFGKIGINRYATPYLLSFVACYYDDNIYTPL